MISVDAAILKFKELIGSDSSWKSLVSSQFVKHLAVFMAWALRAAQWQVERCVQEFFVSTAINRSSILAHAEDREYLPRKPIPSEGTLNITNNGDNTLFVPTDTILTTEDSVGYTVQSGISIPSGGTVACGVSQEEICEYAFVVDEEKSFYEILLDADVSEKISEISVYVNENGADDVEEEWAYARNFRNVSSTSKAYDEFYSHLGCIGIRFGNGIFGSIPPINADVRVVVRVTEGDSYLYENQALYLSDDIADVNGVSASVTISSITAISGGYAAESTEEVRNNLHYWATYAENLVWDEDYIFFIKKYYPTINWIRVWGEQEAEAVYGPSFNFINKIFISAYAQNGETIADSIIEKLSSIPPRLNRSYEWIEPEPSPVTVTITGTVSKKVNAGTVVQAISDSLTTNYSKDSASRRDEIFVNDIYSDIEDLGYFTDLTSRFSVIISGDTEETGLNQMIYIDIANSSISIGY